LEVVDGGVGLPPGVLGPNGNPLTMGVGIRGMHEREAAWRSAGTQTG